MSATKPELTTEIRRILEDVWTGREFIDQATKDILEAFLSGLPKEYESKTGGYLPRYKLGFNDALTQVKRTLNKRGKHGG